MTNKMNEEFIRQVLENMSAEEAVKFIASAITNRDEMIKSLQKNKG